MNRDRHIISDYSTTGAKELSGVQLLGNQLSPSDLVDILAQEYLKRERKQGIPEALLKLREFFKAKVATAKN